MHLGFLQYYEEPVNKVTSEHSTAKNVKNVKSQSRN